MEIHRHQHIGKHPKVQALSPIQIFLAFSLPLSLFTALPLVDHLALSLSLLEFPLPLPLLVLFASCPLLRKFYSCLSLPASVHSCCCCCCSFCCCCCSSCCCCCHCCSFCSHCKVVVTKVAPLEKYSPWHANEMKLFQR